MTYWAYRKKGAARAERLQASRSSPFISSQPTKKLSSGVRKIISTTRVQKYPQEMVRQPKAIMPAPITPPISACEDEDGMAKNQVLRFQTIAAMIPAVRNNSPMVWDSGAV